MLPMLGTSALPHAQLSMSRAQLGPDKITILLLEFDLVVKVI